MIAPRPKDPDDFELLDVDQVKNWAWFILRSVRRRKLLAVVVALATMGAGAGALAVFPRTYRIEAQLLAQRNALMPALGNPSRKIPLEADSPTRAAAETVLRRDNLLSLMKQTDLLKRWEEDRPWALRMKDRVLSLFGTPTEEERIAAMIGFIESRLTVRISEPTVTISLDWPDAQLGYRLVDTALQNFLEQRHSAEVSTIAETISILEGHAANLREAIDEEVEDLKHPPDSASPQPSRSPGAPRRDAATEAIKAEAAEVKVMLDAKQRAINELDEFRRRRLGDLQTSLAQQRAVYADAHPVIQTLLQSISALQEDSPQRVALRKEQHDLQVEYERLSARKSDALLPPSQGRPTDSPRTRPADKRSAEVDAEYARTRLRFAMEKYDALLERLDAARIELDTARAAFKYRYSIIRPPTLPKKPVKPKAPLFLAGAFLASLVLGTLAAALADVWSGKILELWQVQRGLRLPVLGQVPRT